MLPARVLKELANECAPYLSHLYKNCLTVGSIPDIWKTATVSAIFKKGDRYK
ncbi:hypothetical protein DPMN_175779 [Dreissena polymorpha]|uniref:Reverse transcriptase domain-containing protein n=1 Tax=Dreissena polymorpha TaxID=45954 RepID=A0A9D4IJ30_DREPO|nr:hypothetical protein DPMN_175779 [Dreissena polymorpha]